MYAYSQLKTSKKTKSLRNFEVIIVGAGVVGCAVATAQAREGRSVLLVERDFLPPDRIVGELMQPAGIEVLKEIGLLNVISSIDAIPCKGYRLYQDNDQVLELSYKDADVSHGEITEGKSFCYGKFVSALRAECKNNENITFLEAVVTDFVREEEKIVGVKCKEKNSQNVGKIFADLTIVCDGCFSNLRKQFIDSSSRIEFDSHFVGLILENVDLPKPNYGHIFFIRNCITLMYQISLTETRVLMCYPHKILPPKLNGELEIYIMTNVYPHLPKKLQNAFELSLKSKTLKTMPNQYLAPTKISTAGVVILGDALNMRHPLTGSGMTVGLLDAITLSKLISRKYCPDLAATKTVSKQILEFQTLKRYNGSNLNILSIALYHLHSDSSYTAKIIQNGFFAYLSNGGVFIRGPIGFLSGFNRSTFFLHLHFFAMAIYSLFIFWLNLDWLKSISTIPWLIIAPFAIFTKSCSILLPYAYKERFYSHQISN